MNGFELTKPEIDILAEYFKIVEGVEFYADVESNDYASEELRQLISSLFGDHPGEYRLNKYRRWAKEYE